jgi:DNA gyrase subunit A
VAALAVRESDGIVVVSRGGLLVRISGDSISSYGRGTQGVRVVSLKEGDKVISAAAVEEERSEEEPEV